MKNNNVMVAMFCVLLAMAALGCSGTQVQAEVPREERSEEESEQKVAGETSEGYFKDYVYDRLVSLNLKVQEMVDSAKEFDSAKFLDLEDRVRLLDSLEKYKDILGDNIMMMIVQIKSKFEYLKAKYGV